MQILASQLLAVCQLAENSYAREAEVQARFSALMQGLTDGTDPVRTTARFLADFWASRKSWREAADAHEMIAELAPEESFSWLQAAPAIALTGEADACGEQCRPKPYIPSQSDGVRECSARVPNRV